MEIPENGEAEGRTGRQRLMSAALQLAATTRSLASLGLREVARTAGLNPNTFYRHFRNFDELGLAVIAELTGDLRRGLRERRLRPAAEGVRLNAGADPAEALRRAQAIVSASVGLVLDFVADHRQACIVGIREMHGSSAALRRAMRRVLDEMADDIAEDVLGALQLPGLPRAEVEEISRLIVRQMTFFAADYMEHPEQREAIRQQAERFILLLFWGALAARAPALLAGAKLKFPEA